MYLEVFEQSRIRPVLWIQYPASHTPHLVKELFLPSSSAPKFRNNPALQAFYLDYYLSKS
jgi:hypothetical protein